MNGGWWSWIGLSMRGLGKMRGRSWIWVWFWLAVVGKLCTDRQLVNREIFVEEALLILLLPLNIANET